MILFCAFLVGGGNQAGKLDAFMGNSMLGTCKDQDYNEAYCLVCIRSLLQDGSETLPVDQEQQSVRVGRGANEVRIFLRIL